MPPSVFTSLKNTLPPLVPDQPPAPVVFAPQSDAETMAPLQKIPRASRQSLVWAPSAPLTPQGPDRESTIPQVAIRRVPAPSRVRVFASPQDDIQQHLQGRLEQDYQKDADPWGSPDNHPGVFGKIMHGLNVATGGDTRRGWEESGLANRLNEVTAENAANRERGAQADEQEAQAHNLENPPSAPLSTEEGYYSFNPHSGAVEPIEAPGGTTPLYPYQKPGNAQHVVLQGPKGEPMAAVFQNGEYRDATTGQVIPNPIPYEKSPQEHPQAGMANGQPAFAVYDQQNGWLDPKTKQPIANFTPQPSFAQTGLWQPTEGFDPSTGQLVPGGFNERTGQFRPTTVTPGGAPAALPKDVTSELGKELQTAREADKRLRIMQNNEAAALKGDQQAMVSLVANHIGMTLGAQKGARINQAVWDEAVRSAPWLQRAEARFGKDGVLVGVTLAPDQIRQMVQLGQVVRDNQWQQTEQTFGQYGIPINSPEQHEPGSPPAGATMKVPGSDGKLHWSDGKRDLGVVEGR